MQGIDNITDIVSIIVILLALAVTINLGIKYKSEKYKGRILIFYGLMFFLIGRIGNFHILESFIDAKLRHSLDVFGETLSNIIGLPILIIGISLILFETQKRKLALKKVEEQIMSGMADREKIEKDLSDSNEKLYNILSNTDAVIIQVDANGMILFNEGKALSKVNVKPGELVGKSLFSLLADYEIIMENVKKALDGERADFIARVENIVFDVIFSPLTDVDGNKNGGIVLCTDITEVKRIEAELETNKKRLLEAQEAALDKEKEKNSILENTIKVKDEFLSVISHEFKTPLTVINSAVQAMEVICKDEMSDKAKWFLKSIKQNTFRQWRLVNNLLDITRAKAGRIILNKTNLDIVNLTKEIIESIRIYALQKELELIFTSQIEQKIIGIDDELYERILMNLLSNAIKYTPKGKSIIVRISALKEFVKIEVKDSGLGIPEDKLDLIFERFGQVDNSLTRKAEGSGIGLSLVKMLVETLGGKITVRSKEGHGSVFTVLIPSIKVNKNDKDNTSRADFDNRLMHSVAIEFSDIYLS